MPLYQKCSIYQGSSIKHVDTFIKKNVTNCLYLCLALLVSGCAHHKSHTDLSTTQHSETILAEKPNPTPPITHSSEATNPLVWERLVNGYGLKIPRKNSRIASHIQYYRKHPKYLERVFTRAKPFLVFIMNEVEKRKMPMEIALLPVVESAFQPYAFSHGSAAGLWQFIPSTGRLFGLKQNWWYDGRRDIYASTHAALDYLEKLNRKFDGDWALALGAYNAGPGTISRAIRRNQRAGKSTSFYQLKIPRETKNYVPKLMALATVIKNRDKYNIALPQINNTLAIEVMELPSQTDLAVAAKMADLTMDEFYALNPPYNRWSTSPSGPHRFIIPIEKKALFKTNLARTPKDQRLAWSIHRVKSGDTLSAIARKHKISLKQLQDANDLSSTFLSINQTLKIPQSNQPQHHYTQSSSMRFARHKPGKDRLKHQVKKGESLWSIARRYKVKTKSIAQWNRMSTKETLVAGKILTLWLNPGHSTSKHSQQASRYTKKIHYKVRRGESLSRIASKFQVALRDIASWNPRTVRKRYLQPGDRLTLFVDIRR